MEDGEPAFAIAFFCCKGNILYLSSIIRTAAASKRGGYDNAQKVLRGWNEDYALNLDKGTLSLNSGQEDSLYAPS